MLGNHAYSHDIFTRSAAGQAQAIAFQRPRSVRRAKISAFQADFLPRQRRRFVIQASTPYNPYFYGQPERTNRDRRAWLADIPCPSPDELASGLEHCVSR